MGLFDDPLIADRLVVAFESIGESLKGLNESVKRAGNRYWPEPRGPREAILSRVETDEDRAKKALGDTDQPINEWLTDLGDPEEGDHTFDRTRQYIRDHPEEFKIPNVGPKAPAEQGLAVGGPQQVERKSRGTAKSSADNAPAKERARRKKTRP
jgi:hypothetical protein